MGVSDMIRRRIGRQLRDSGALREVRDTVRATEKKMATEHTRVDRHIERTERQAERQAKRLDQLAEALASVQERLQPAEQIARLREVDHERMCSQVAALEARVARLEQLQSDGPLVADAEATAASTSLLDEIRREHEQIRVRMQIITWYEERLRRVESSLLALYEGDRRHPV